MSWTQDDSDILKLVDGVQFTAGLDSWSLGPLKLSNHSWIALVPDDPEPTIDPSGTLAWILATMQEPPRGTVSFLGQDVYHLEPGPRQRLRANIGFVHSYGGLLSARTVRENIALPVSVHGQMSQVDEDIAVQRILDELALDRVANLRPHEMTGATRWKACLARALVLNPKLLILEGLGNWEMDRGRGAGWKRIEKYFEAGIGTIVICLARQNPEFEQWFLEHRGEIMNYTKIANPIEERTAR
jgi:ABC-type ATPase involved in cell division